MPSLILTSFIAAAVLVTAAPGFAAGSSQPTTKLKYDAKTQKYCVTSPAVTGSHLTNTACKTATQWSAEGLDMPKTALVQPGMPAPTPAETELAQK